MKCPHERKKETERETPKKKERNVYSQKEKKRLEGNKSKILPVVCNYPCHEIYVCVCVFLSRGIY